MDEVKSFIELFSDQEIGKYSKAEWKKLVKESVREKNRKDLLWQMRGYSKLDHRQLEKEKFEIQPYMYQLRLKDARLRFKLRSSMVPTVKLHFLNNDQYRRDNYQCWDCSFVDSSEHIMKTCGAYEEFRRGKNLDNDLDLVNFFHQVIEKRLNSEDSNDPGDLC